MQRFYFTLKEFFFIWLITCGTMAFGQSERAHHINQIQEKRIASNQHLKSHNLDELLTAFVEDVVITTGAGHVINGRASLKSYLRELFDVQEDIYFVRTSSEITTNRANDRAWEKGTWKGYRPKTKGWSQPQGNYAAMWVLQNGEWKIRSELFVTIE